MSTIDQQFVEYVVKTLVEHPEDVQVERIIDEKGVLLTLTVNPEDLGRVIGRRGSNASSLRTLLRALGIKNEARYNLKIVDNKEKDAAELKNDDKTVETKTESETVVDKVNQTNDHIAEPVEKVEKIAKLTQEDLAQLDNLDI